MGLELVTLLLKPFSMACVKVFDFFQPQTHTIDSNFPEAALEAHINTTELSSEAGLGTMEQEEQQCLETLHELPALQPPEIELSECTI